MHQTARETVPAVLCIIGRKNSGKTELTVRLAGELGRRGYRVMTAKHGHGFRLDHPGRDSWRHRHEGGAVRTVLAGPGEFAVMGRWPEQELPLAELVRRFLFDADIVLAEGFKGEPEPKIEVYRDGLGEPPVYSSGGEDAARVVAVVTDRRELGSDRRVFDLRAPDFVLRLADFVEARYLRSGATEGSPPFPPSVAPREELPSANPPPGPSPGGDP